MEKRTSTRGTESDWQAGADTLEGRALVLGPGSARCQHVPSVQLLLSIPQTSFNAPEWRFSISVILDAHSNRCLIHVTALGALGVSGLDAPR